VVAGSLDIIAKILHLAGAPGQMSELVASCQAKFGDSIERLWVSAAQMGEKMKESVLSTDYELVYLKAGSSFDNRVAQNQASRLKAGKKTKEKVPRVLCTSDLGLQRTANLAKPGESKGRVETALMLKAMVIFESEMDDLLSQN